MPEVTIQPGELHKVTVTEWIDGDTFHATYRAKVETRTTIKLPWQPKKAIEIVQTGEAVIPVVVRCWGINTPELHAPDRKPGQAAKEYAQKLAPSGTIVTALLSARSEEKFGRWLADVQLSDGRMFREVMIKAGKAVEYYGGQR